MEKFKKREINKKGFLENDNGIKISTLLSLIKENQYYGDIIDYFNVDPDSSELVQIKGSQTLYTVVKGLNDKFKKVDLVSNLKNLSFDYENGFSIKFDELKTDSYFDDYHSDSISVRPIHSGQRDFFANLYEIDKYASRLINKGFGDVLDMNLSLLKEKDEHIKKYRLLHDVKEDSFYLRAIVSEDRYFNYDNSVAVVLALLKLHFETKESGVEYELYSCEFNESFIRMFFRTSELKEIQGVGYLENTLQVSNDEIKREALKFANICSILFEDSEAKSQSLFIKPKDVKSKVLSITHGTGPKKAFLNLEDFVRSKEIFENIFEEIKVITKIKNHNQILHLLREKIENSNTEEIKRSKEELKKILYKDIKTTSQLLETFNKLILLEGLEIDAKEYLRYKIYEALVDRK
ncbi:hypothetical protein [Flagellimonas oceanensis]|uniref:hypothetical protein n=1 Tax=Flagellimonas oceanensis TaxID=2499163 RepID=UPI000F8E970D|nr:hypothetical protein [Allomuricauda oceanensis]